jgi:chaperonin GroES
MSKLIPLSDFIVVKPLGGEDQTASGIYIPATASKEKPQEGEIIAAGPGRKNEDGSRQPMDLEVGDIVMFKKYAPDEFKKDGQDLLVLRETDVIAKLQK